MLGNRLLIDVDAQAGRMTDTDPAALQANLFAADLPAIRYITAHCFEQVAEFFVSPVSLLPPITPVIPSRAKRPEHFS